MALTSPQLVPWLEAFLAADLAAHDRGDDSARAPYCTPEVAEGMAEMPRRSTPTAPRTLFKCVAHDHPTMGPWVAAMVSEGTEVGRGTGKYHLLLVVRPERGPQITGVYDVCTACVALGRDGQGAECIECGGLGWEPWFGEALGDTFGPVTAVDKITKPATSLYHAAWKRGELR